MQASLELLHSKRTEWAELGYAEKTELLEGMLKRFQTVDLDRWSLDAMSAQGYVPGPGFGETVASVEQIANVSVIAMRLRSMIRTYKHLADHGTPPQPVTKSLEDGRSISTVFPFDKEDKTNAPYAGVSIDIISRPSESGKLQDVPGTEPGLCLVLGAGNQSFLAFGDVLHWMFMEGKVRSTTHLTRYCTPSRTACAAAQDRLTRPSPHLHPPTHYPLSFARTGRCAQAPPAACIQCACIRTNFCRSDLKRLLCHDARPRGGALELVDCTPARGVRPHDWRRTHP